MTHLDALELNLSHERVRLANARTAGERELRAVWVAQLEREIAAELVRLGKSRPSDVSIDELARELGA